LGNQKKTRKNFDTINNYARKPELGKIKKITREKHINSKGRAKRLGLTTAVKVEIQKQIREKKDERIKGRGTRIIEIKEG